MVLLCFSAQKLTVEQKNVRRFHMNFSFEFGNHKQNEQFNESAKKLAETVNNFNKAMKDGLTQYNETRKIVEENINRGTRITKHRINL